MDASPRQAISFLVVMLVVSAVGGVCTGLLGRLYARRRSKHAKKRLLEQEAAWRACNNARARLAMP